MVTQIILIILVAGLGIRSRSTRLVQEFGVDERKATGEGCLQIPSFAGTRCDSAPNLTVEDEDDFGRMDDNPDHLYIYMPVYSRYEARWRLLLLLCRHWCVI